MGWGQALAAFRAAAFEHKLPALRAHAHAEAMSFCATAIVRLKCPFHAIHLSINVSTEKIKAIGRRGRCQVCVKAHKRRGEKVKGVRDDVIQEVG